MTWVTRFNCHHPKASRSVAPCGWVEVCVECRATRWTAEPHVASTEKWKPARRRQVFDGERLLMFGPCEAGTGERLYAVRELCVNY